MSLRIERPNTTLESIKKSLEEINSNKEGKHEFLSLKESINLWKSWKL